MNKKLSLQEMVEHLHGQLENMHSQVTLLMAQVYEAIRPGKVPGGDLADLGYFIRNSERLLDDARKELSAKRSLVDKLIAMEVIRKQAADPSAEHRCDGKKALALPSVSISAKIPDPGTPEYDVLLKHFGVDVSKSKYPGIHTLSFRHMTEYLTQCAADGINPPPGLGKTFEQVTVRYSPRK